jgi:hypothetical protein
MYFPATMRILCVASATILLMPLKRGGLRVRPGGRGWGGVLFFFHFIILFLFFFLFFLFCFLLFINAFLFFFFFFIFSSCFPFYLYFLF